MASKVFFVFGLICLGISLSLMKIPTPNNKASNILYINPLILKAISGYAHTLMADYFVLEATYVSEMRVGGSYLVDTQQFVDAYTNIIHLDPYFFEPLQYSVVFLNLIKKEYESAKRLLEIPDQYKIESFDLLFFKLLMYATYSTDTIDIGLLKSWIKKLSLYAKHQQVFGTIVVKDMYEVFLRLAQNKNIKSEKKKSDLFWLYKNTKDPKRKAQIQEKIDTLNTSSP